MRCEEVQTSPLGSFAVFLSKEDGQRGGTLADNSKDTIAVSAGTEVTGGTISFRL
jgi:predicted transcriptional regulator